MTNITNQSVFIRSGAVLFTEIQDTMSLMDMDNGQYFDYDATGAEIWKLVDGDRSVAQICAALQESFDVDPATCHADTLEFLKELQRLSLVSVK